MMTISARSLGLDAKSQLQRLITSCVEITTQILTSKLHAKDATLVRVLWKGTLLRLDSRRSGVGLQRDIQAYELNEVLETS